VAIEEIDTDNWDSAPYTSAIRKDTTASPSRPAHLGIILALHRFACGAIQPSLIQEATPCSTFPPIRSAAMAGPRIRPVLQLYSFPHPMASRFRSHWRAWLAVRSAFDQRKSRRNRTPAVFLTLNPNGKIPAIMIRMGRTALDRFVRVGRDSTVSGGEDWQAAPAVCGRALQDHPVGILSDVGYRADVRTARVLPQVRPAARLTTSARSSVSALSTTACSVSSSSGWRTENGSWRHLHHRRYFVDRLVRSLTTLIDAGDLVHYDELKSVPAWLQRCLARVAVQRGLNIPPRP